MQAAQSELRAQQAQLSVTTSFVGMLLHELKNPWPRCAWPL
jgi:nitrogen-specific signal transduction histidine kinase